MPAETTSYALDKDGHIYAWGNINNNTGYGNKPIQLDLFERMIQISGKYGLKADGTIWQIPNKNASSVIIQKDTKDVRFIKVASNDHIGDGSATNIDTTHTLLIARDGGLYTFGDNKNGELGVGELSDISSVGTNDIQFISTLGKVIDIAAGYRYSVAITENGDVYAWGINEEKYQSGQKIKKDYKSPSKVEYIDSAKNIIFVAAGINHTVTIDSDGYVWSFGANEYSQLGNQDNANAYIPVIAGKMQLSVKPQVIRLDKGSSVNVSVGDTNNNALTVTIAEYLNLLGKTTSTDNSYTVESLDTSVVRVESDGLTITGVKDGKAILKVVKTSSNTIGYVTVYVGQNGGIYPMVDGGKGHSIALKYDGTVWTWGLNDSNQLGYETENGMSLEPKKVTLGANNEQAVLIAAGDKYNLAIGMSSKVYSWGNNNNGQLGNGNDDRSATGIDTVKYKDGTDVEGAVGISTHGNTAYILLANGTVAVFGEEYDNQNYCINRFRFE